MHERPVFSDTDRADVVRVLKKTYAVYSLDIAGPALSFEEKSAQSAAEFLAAACWFLVSGEEGPEVVENALRFPLNPTSAEAHLSADLCLRFLATVYRRVRTRPRDDVLHHAIVDVLRRWPLSGAMADLSDEPLGDVRFHDHYGLQLLYAERLSAAFRRTWAPSTGRTREVIELVFQQQGKTMPESSDKGAGE